ncbi:MAG: hypothetical protein ACE5I7_18595, partial [Candidatus Binatia bacterium]
MEAAAAARSPGRSSRGRRLRRDLEGFAVVAGYVGLTLWLLSPLFAHPTQEVVNPLAEGTGGWLSLPDVNLIMWVLAWDCHALATAPWRLFDANIFYPAPSALAGSEHMLGHLVIFGPVYGVSGNPVLANQINLLLSIALCGAAMYALLRHWGTPAAAALFGGFVYAFAPIRIYGTPHVHLLAGQYLPLALLFLDRTLTHESVRAALAFGAFLLLQMLCSYYLAYMTATALVGYAIGVACSTRMRLSRRGVTLVLAAAAVAGVLLTLVSLPYLAAKEIGV